MKILLKCPTRSRPSQFLSVLQKYVSLANRPDLLGVCVSCDLDDTTMRPDEIQFAIKNITYRTAWSDIRYGNNTSKIEAANADMSSIPWEWDIVVLVSDDMVPQVKGYDDALRTHMTANFADTDGILWVNDGTQGNKLNTITILGRKMYESFGYLYHPAYKSLFCDTEFTDLCTGKLASKCTYIPYMLIRHEHPGTGFPERRDGLYARNQTYWSQDMMTYIARKEYAYDWSILIPTMTGREESLKRLLQTINELKAQVCPSLRIEICMSYDNREKKIGQKRQELLQGAKGKYFSFIDDDDLVTQAYFEDALATINGSYHCCRLRGQIGAYTFTHSVENTLGMPMAIGDVFIRPPNHLNVMMTDIGKLVSFGNATRGEDLDWTIRLAQAGYLRTEYQSDPSRIHYIYNIAGGIHPETIANQRRVNYQTMLKAVWSDNGSTLPVATFGEPRAGLRLSGRGFVSK